MTLDTLMHRYLVSPSHHHQWQQHQAMKWHHQIYQKVTQLLAMVGMSKFTIKIEIQ